MNFLFLALAFFQRCQASPPIQVFVELSPAGSFVAEGARLDGSVTKSGGGFVAKRLLVPLNTLRTGIALRDDHMKNRFLEISKFPVADLRDVRAANGKFAALLFLKGKSSKIQGTYTVDGLNIRAEFSFNLSEFGLQAPKYLGVGVEDAIRVAAELSVPR